MIDRHRRPQACPYPFESASSLAMPDEYAFRRTRAPVAEVELSGANRAWLLTRYDDVREALKDTEVFSRREADRMQIPGYPPLQGFVLGEDGPQHRRIRGAAQYAFTPRRVEDLRAQIRDDCSRLLGDIAERGGPADLVTALAMPLALNAIGALLGVPVNDRAQFTRWGHAFLTMGSDAVDAAEAQAAAAQMAEYLGKLIVQRKTAHTGDLLSDIVQDADDLTTEEIINLAIGALVAGWETTAAAIEVSVLHLLTHPADAAYLRAHPERVKDMVEELLRVTRFGEGDGLPRVATRDVVIHGVTIRKGDIVLMSVASANMDEEVFDHATSVDFERGAQVDPHLSFGWGPHFCLGAHLARIEIQEALTALFTRLPALALAVPADQASKRVRGASVSGLEELLVTW